MNAVIASGNLTADVESRSAGDHEVQRFTLAINQGDHTTFLPVEAWNMPHLERFLRKGSKVLVRGSLRQSQWETDAGERRSRFFANAYEVEFLDRRPGPDSKEDANDASAPRPARRSPGRGRAPKTAAR